MTHFTNFCTDCGVFDVTTFTLEENAKIKRFDDIVTAVWENARQGTTAYDDCKANIIGDFICDLVAINDHYAKRDFLSWLDKPEAFEKALDTYMATLDQEIIARYSGEYAEDARNISTELYNFL
jgi:hypothetical protein